ncbi:hypothetical protein, partial [Pseudomonas aeruginosa]
YSSLDAAARRAVTQAALSVRRGQIESDEIRAKKAAAQREDRVGMFEAEVIKALLERGVHAEGQRAIGPYNMDIALDEPSVAVEIYSIHPTKERMARLHQRAEYILDTGTSMLVVQVTYPRRIFDLSAVCEKIISFHDFVRRNKALAGHYGVIRGNGEHAPTSSHKLNGRPLIVGF